MVASRRSILILSVKDGFPTRSVFVKLVKVKACVGYFLKIHYTSDLIT